MKFSIVFLISILASTLFGTFLIFRFPELNKPNTILFFLIIGFVIGLLREYLVTSSAPDRKSQIYSEILKMYNGKMNSNGNPEFYYEGWKIIVGYDYQIINHNYLDFVIANIDLSGLDNPVIESIKQKFETEVIYNKDYARYYSHWGYEGSIFKERIINKVEELSNFINEKTVANKK